MAHHKTWTIEETERLRRHIMEGGSVGRAAVIFRRTVPAVRSYARTLDLSFPSIAQLRRAGGVTPPDRQSSQASRLSFRQRHAMEGSAADE